MRDFAYGKPLMTEQNFDARLPVQRFDIPGVGPVEVPTPTSQDDFANLDLSKEQICFLLAMQGRRIDALERRLNALEGIDNEY
jgi:hypothetical protein